MRRSLSRGQLLLATCALSASGAPLWAAGMARVRAGFDPIEAESNVFAAQAERFFERGGVSVEAQGIKNGAAIAAAILGGSIDIGAVNISSLLAAHGKGLPFTIIAMGEMYTAASPTCQLLAPSDSTLSPARDLSGRVVAVNIINGLGHLATRDWIDKNGGDSTAVRYIEMPFSAMPAALAAHRVDAASVVEPELSAAKRAGARVLADAYNAVGREFLISAWVATTAWVEEHADAAHRFSSALHAAEIWANHHRDATAAITSRALETDVATIRSITRATYAEHQRGPALVQPVIDAAARYHLVSADTAAVSLFSPQAVISAS